MMMQWPNPSLADYRFDGGVFILAEISVLRVGKIIACRDLFLPR
jgi:hypothetical protein